MREGFYLAVEQAYTPILKKERMTKSLDTLTADTLHVIFNAKNAMEASEFLAMCIFSIAVPKNLEDIFRACVHQMTYNEDQDFLFSSHGMNILEGRKSILSFWIGQMTLSSHHQHALRSYTFLCTRTSTQCTEKYAIVSWTNHLVMCN